MFDSKILGNRMSHDDDALSFQPKQTIYALSPPKWKFFSFFFFFVVRGSGDGKRKWGVEGVGVGVASSRGSRDRFGKIEDITMRCNGP